MTLGIIGGISLYRINQKRKDKKHLKLVDRWQEYFESFLTDGNEGNFMVPLKYYKKLQSMEELMAFYAVSQSAPIKASGALRQFIRENKSAWVSLGQVYGKKKSMEKAYFAFVCEKLRINHPNEFDEMTEMMMGYALAPSIYCRENALKALYAFGNVDAVIEVMIKLSRNNNTHHRKLITDGLLKFKGDQTALAESLFDHFEHFNPEYQVAIIDFFRFTGEQLRYKLINLLKQGNTDKDIVCALLRYYTKYNVQEYKEIILSYLQSPHNEDWECVSTAALALGKYPGEDTIHALKSVLSSKYWYVRLNAARSIAELGIEEDKLLDILQGQDNYAKEQLMYHIKNKKEKRLQYG